MSQELSTRFSALQRAEIAEILTVYTDLHRAAKVSVLFNEPKLLKFILPHQPYAAPTARFSALQRAEIAEIDDSVVDVAGNPRFQCSSTSRNC